MASIQDVYGHLKTLTKKWFYDKTEVDNKLSNKESTSNKTTALSSSSTNTQYPSAKAVFDALQLVDGGGSGLDIDDFYIDTSTDEIVIVTGSSSGSGSSVTIADNLTTNDSSQVLSARQGKILNDKIGDILTIINGSGNNG